MNVLDIILLVITASCLAYSIIKGATRTIFRILAFTLGYLASLHLSYIFYPWLGKFISQPALKEAIANFIIFILVFFGIILLGTFFYFLIKLIKLKLVDRIAGGFVGISLGFCIGWITIMILFLFFNMKSPIMKNSRFTPYFLKFGNLTNEYLPKKWTDPIKENYLDFKKYKEITKKPSKLMNKILEELK
jgi:membrane protein required for colicin V production